MGGAGHPVGAAHPAVSVVFGVGGGVQSPSHVQLFCDHPLPPHVL